MQINLELRPPYIAFISPLHSYMMVASTINCTHGVVPGYSNGQTWKKNYPEERIRNGVANQARLLLSALPVGNEACRYGLEDNIPLRIDIL